jgi:hypothetical protein
MTSEEQFSAAEISWRWDGKDFYLQPNNGGLNQPEFLVERKLHGNGLHDELGVMALAGGARIPAGDFS